MELQTVLETPINNSQKIVRIGLLGLGTVGSGVVKLLSRFPEIHIEQIAIKDDKKSRDLSGLSPEILTTDINAVVENPDIDILIEVMGGEELPYQVIQKALQAGKHVVTANKVVIAKHGPQLFELAHQHGRNILFEAAVAGGIPIILPLKTSLVANNIKQIAGILNGTTNYILTRMEQAGLDFKQALKEAQDKGFAEADPTSDIEGHDAACKIGILASIAFQKQIDQKAIYTEGISQITAEDIAMADSLGYGIKLIALAKSTDSDAVDVRVHPMLVSKSHPLSKIQFENNAIWVQGDAVGDVMFYGKGAGELPTASAVVGDVMMLAKAMTQERSMLTSMQFDTTEKSNMLPIEKTASACYIRLETEDAPGVIGNLGKACGDHDVSLNAVTQKGIHFENHSATIVLLTHEVLEKNLQAALKTIQAQPTTKKIHSVLRVFAP